VRLFAGDDWAEDHHDIEVMDEAGKVLVKRRLPEGAAGMTQLHALIGRFLPEDADDAEVVIGIETDRGPWVAALVAAGYVVFPVNPLQASRYRERHGVSGAKSDGGDAHMLADMLRAPGQCVACLEWQRLGNDRVRRDLQTRRRHHHNRRVSMVNYLSSETRPEKSRLWKSIWKRRFFACRYPCM